MRYIYFIGIGGIGMSALARYYNNQGEYVAGYDRTFSPVTEALEKEGFTISYEDSTETVPDVIEQNRDNCTVIYTPAIPADSVQLNWFRNNGYTLVKRSEALGTIAANKTTVAIAGTHGKTTTSTMVAHIFENSGKGCNAFLGGISSNYNTNLLLSKNDVIVAEADEFDRSFLQLWPDIAVITSADADHLDIYKDYKTIREAFSLFASQVKKEGTLILREGLDDIITDKTNCKILRYSFDQKSDFYASDIKMKAGGYLEFTFCYPGGSEKGFTLGIPGWINVENAIAAAASSYTYGISLDSIKKALATFKGVKRRFDIKINTPQCAYIDDYAHHPKEISAAMSSIREIFKDRKITVIFQPHLYSRTRDFADEFAQSLSSADELILLDIYPARELPIEGVTSSIIFDKVKIKKKRLTTRETLVEEIEKEDTDTIVTFGAGDIDRIVEPLTRMLKKKYNVQ